MKASGHGSRCRCGLMAGAGLWRSVAEIDGSPRPVGPADVVPAVPAVVGSRSSHAALPVSSSYDT